MSSFGVVLDASVLIPAALRDTLLRAAQEGLYRLFWSRDILEEVRRNLVENRLTTEDGARRVLEHMMRAFPDALVEGYETLILSMSNHPKDRHVLAAAVEAGAQVIVTTNLRHFSPADTSRHGVEAQSPDSFLTDLFDFAPEAMVEILKSQAAALTRPPETVEDVLSALAVFAPSFAATVVQVLREGGPPQSD